MAINSWSVAGPPPTYHFDKLTWFYSGVDSWRISHGFPSCKPLWRCFHAYHIHLMIAFSLLCPIASFSSAGYRFQSAKLFSPTCSRTTYLGRRLSRKFNAPISSKRFQRLQKGLPLHVFILTDFIKHTHLISTFEYFSLHRFWFPLLLSVVLIAALVILSTPLVPIEWRVRGQDGWAVIFPVAWVSASLAFFYLSAQLLPSSRLLSGCHILFPVRDSNVFCVPRVSHSSRHRLC